MASAGTASGVSTVKLRLADGFDFPVGRPDASGYYKARGFWPNGHLGEDWNGRGGGNTDLGDPVYACADGVVVHSRDVRVGWGNVVIIRHAYRDNRGGRLRPDRRPEAYDDERREQQTPSHLDRKGS